MDAVQRLASRVLAIYRGERDRLVGEADRITDLRRDFDRAIRTLEVVVEGSPPPRSAVLYSFCSILAVEVLLLVGIFWWV